VLWRDAAPTHKRKDDVADKGVAGNKHGKPGNHRQYAYEPGGWQKFLGEFHFVFND
jgi:hypothetical protein